ncbi:MAG: methylmalonyl Co-A mutase-associated GTPase MeaB, partial [Thermodesulfobacteriota bacterium]
MADTDKNKKNELSISEYVEGILGSDITVLSKAITVIESTTKSDTETAEQIIENCLPHSGDSIRIGISGIPGVGKSTFIDSFGTYLTGDVGKKVAVLAVDPSSQITKGSILGDKVRMGKLSKNPDAYIRSSPSSGHLGGVTSKTREAVILCEAAGFDTIIIETVGVGQSETAVNSMVDFFLLLHLAGAGDELQGIKRGIMEIADAIVINKADGPNIQRSKLAKKEIESALQLFPLPDSGWKTRALTCSSTEKTGIDSVWNTIEEYYKLTINSGYFIKNRQEQSKYWLHETVTKMLEDSFY